MKFLVAVSLIVVASSCILGVRAKDAPCIVNGTEVADNAYPFQVSVQKQGKGHWCGAVIITPNYVLTAAHCNDHGYFHTYPASLYSVRVGSALHASGGNVVPIAEIKRHPAYKNYAAPHDIALWRLANPLTFSKSVQAISIAVPPPPGSKVTAIGWGKIEFGGKIPARMLEATMYAMSSEDCRAYTRQQTDGILCLARKDISGICSGDSGGAAIYENTLVGLSSYGLVESCSTTYPDMFANVSHYLDWVKENSDL